MIHTVSNGVLENGEILFDKGKIISVGSNLDISTDTEIIIHLLAREKGDTLAEKLEKALLKIEGAYSLILLSPNEVSSKVFLVLTILICIRRCLYTMTTFLRVTKEQIIPTVNQVYD